MSIWEYIATQFLLMSSDYLYNWWNKSWGLLYSQNGCTLSLLMYVFNPCIQYKPLKKNHKTLQLKVIYDAAHALVLFSTMENQSLSMGMLAHVVSCYKIISHWKVVLFFLYWLVEGLRCFTATILDTTVHDFHGLGINGKISRLQYMGFMHHIWESHTGGKMWLTAYSSLDFQN
jgi:hypothetical protein